jgi:hypothetical protein
VNHAVVTEHLADYLEGDLALDLRALVDAHLDGCPACALEVREMQQTIRLLRALPEPEPPPMIAANVMRRIRAGETRPSVFERIQRVLGGVLEPSFVLPASALAVAALVIFAIQGGGRLTGALYSQDYSQDDSPGEWTAQGSGEPLAASGPVRATPTAAGQIDRNFGASVARDLAAAPVPSPGFAPVETGREGDGAAPLAAARREGLRADSTFAVRAPMAVAPWDSRSARRGFSGPSDASASFFGDPVLAQGFAAEIAGPGATSASNRVSGATGTAVPTALSRRTPGAGQGHRVEDSGGEDPRDAWLAQALENPVEFAHYIARHNLAEQELWVERLSERALSRGLLTELVDALRAAGDDKTSWLADDFSAQQKAAQAKAADSSAAGGEPEREGGGSPGLAR